MKIISFAYWGGRSQRGVEYLDGAAANIELARKHYPGWECRVYCNQQADVFEKLGYQVVHKQITKGPWEGLFWRFEPIFDPTVTRFISRDLDSRLNPREAAAVAQWESTECSFHVMRDNWQHNVPMPGGMWGAVHWPKFEELLSHWDKFDRRGVDQAFLEWWIWPIAISDCWANDTVTEFARISQPWPKHEPMDKNIHGQFVGSLVP